MGPRQQVLELRNYVMHPGQRDVLIDIFERRFIEPQEALGAQVLGSFRDLDDANRYPWLRGFRDFSTRLTALEAFYTSEVWKAHRDAANATMVASDDVLLLRPFSGDIAADGATRAPIGATASSGALFIATIYFFPEPAEAAFGEFFLRNLSPFLAASGSAPLATFVSEHAPNNYPRLPVRQNENVFLSLSRFASAAEHEAHTAALKDMPEWRRLAAALGRERVSAQQTLRLQPTPRSLLR
jgi:hypothetical protein